MSFAHNFIWLNGTSRSLFGSLENAGGNHRRAQLREDITIVPRRTVPPHAEIAANCWWACRETGSEEKPQCSPANKPGWSAGR